MNCSTQVLVGIALANGLGVQPQEQGWGADNMGQQFPERVTSELTEILTLTALPLADAKT